MVQPKVGTGRSPVSVVESLARTDQLIIAKHAPGLSFEVPLPWLRGVRAHSLSSRPIEFTPAVTARNTAGGMRTVPNPDLRANANRFVTGADAPVVDDAGARIMAALPRSVPALRMRISIGLS